MDGLTAAQHARISADYVALKRVAPLACFTYTLASSTVTLHDYVGMNGVGSAYAWTAVANGTGDVTFTYVPRNFENEYGESAPIAARAAQVTAHGSAARYVVVELGRASIRIRTFDEAGSPVDAKVTVKIA